jgi:hypothetical protein
MPPWPSRAPAWTALSALPRSISGCGGWAGSLKKTLAAAERDRPEVAARRADGHMQLAAEPVAALVFVDESGAHTKMTRLRGRAPGGQRLLASIPHGHYQTSTLISGVRLGGSCAPWLFRGPMNGEMFLAWVRQGLAPTLRPGDVVILDNLATHKIHGVREALEAVGGRLLFLPPYSPDFNPIEPLLKANALISLEVRCRNCRSLVEEQVVPKWYSPFGTIPRMGSISLDSCWLWCARGDSNTRPLAS